MISKEVEKHILDLAASTDEEIGGYINQEGQFIRLENHAVDKKNEFTHRWLPKEAKAIVHSHPGGPHYPSEQDMRSQLSLQIPSGIAAVSDAGRELFWFGDEVPVPPLIGRGFRHGVTDCYSLIRDFYKLTVKINLPQFPRGWKWWKDGQCLYEMGFGPAGFSEVPLLEMQPGDGFLMCIRSNTPNHAGVYLGAGLILHHLTSAGDGVDPSRLSMREPLGKWAKLITKVVRHENHTAFRAFGDLIRI